MDEALWADHHHAKYRIGDLVCLLMVAKETDSSNAAIRDIRKQIKSAIAYARAIADQRNAELRDESGS